MPRNGLGVYRLAFRPVVNGPASLDSYNGQLQDMQDEMNNSLAADGSTPMTNPLKFEGYKLDLDADTDTSIDSSTDDRIDFEINGSDALQLTASKAQALNSFSDESGAANTILYSTASNVYDSTAITTIGRAFIACADAGDVFDVIEGGGYGETFIETKTASNSATIDFTAIPTTYSSYMFRFRRVIPSAANPNLAVRTSTDGGSTYDSGGSDYNYTAQGTGATQVGSAILIDFSTSDISPTNSVGLNMEFHLILPADATYCNMWWEGAAYENATPPSLASGIQCGRRMAAANVDAIRFYFSSGNITSGEITMYGRA